MNSKSNFSTAYRKRPFLQFGQQLLLDLSAFLVTGTSGSLSHSAIEHENALFAAESTGNSPPQLSTDDRIRIWDSLGIYIDDRTAGAWMPVDMVQTTDFTPKLHQPQLLASPVQPRFPTALVAQAFVVISDDHTKHPVVNAISSGALTITVKDATQKVLTNQRIFLKQLGSEATT
jgi:hypothetical protein